MYHQRLDLAFEDLHASRGNNWPHVWDHALTEDLADQTVVALETSCSWVLHRKPVVVIWRHKKKKHRSWFDCPRNRFSCTCQKTKKQMCSTLTIHKYERLQQTTAHVIQTKIMQILLYQNTINMRILLNTYRVGVKYRPLCQYTSLTKAELLLLREWDKRLIITNYNT